MLFFLYGDDDYRSNEKLNQIKEKFIKNIDESGYNIVILDEDITVEKFTKEFSQTGFLARKKLVIIKNLLKQNISQELSNIILDYLNKIKDEKNENIIVFWESDLPHSKKSPLSGVKLEIYKKLNSFKYNQEFKKLSNFKVIQWVQSRFKKNNKVIDQKLANIMLALIGNDLWLLDNEITKICNYNKEERINKKSIDKLVSASLSDDIFLFSERLANQDKLEAVKLLNEQIKSGVSPIYLLTMIIRQFRILLQIRSALDEKVSVNNLSNYLSLHPFVIKKNMASVELYSFEELKTIYRKLLRLEKKIKSSRLKPSTLLNLFILDL